MAQSKQEASFASRLWNWALIILLPLIPFNTGCENSCFTFVSNPGGAGSIAHFSSPCPLPAPQGTVQAAAEIAIPCESCSPSNRVQSLVVSLSGIALHRQIATGNGPDEWEEVHPDLEFLPQQFALVTAGPNGRERTSLGDPAPLPAGSYDRVRLRFVSGRESDRLQRAAGNPCGASGVHCAVMGDGRVLPLVAGDMLELPIILEPVANGVLTILPGAEHRLLIRLTSVWYPAEMPGKGRQLLLHLTGDAIRSAD